MATGTPRSHLPTRGTVGVITRADAVHPELVLLRLPRLEPTGRSTGLRLAGDDRSRQSWIGNPRRLLIGSPSYGHDLHYARNTRLRRKEIIPGDPCDL